MPRAARLLLLLHVVAAAERRRLGDTLDKEGLRNLADNGAPARRFDSNLTPLTSTLGLGGAGGEGSGRR